MLQGENSRDLEGLISLYKAYSLLIPCRFSYIFYTIFFLPFPFFLYEFIHYIFLQRQGHIIYQNHLQTTKSFADLKIVMNTSKFSSRTCRRSASRPSSSSRRGRSAYSTRTLTTGATWPSSAWSSVTCSVSWRRSSRRVSTPAISSASPRAMPPSSGRPALVIGQLFPGKCSGTSYNCVELVEEIMYYVEWLIVFWGVQYYLLTNQYRYRYGTYIWCNSS